MKRSLWGLLCAVVIIGLAGLSLADEHTALQDFKMDVKVPKYAGEALNFMKNCKVPEPLKILSTQGADWLSPDLFPEMAVVEEVALENKVLYLRTDRDVANIVISETDVYDSESFVDYNSASDRKISTKNEARVELMNPQTHHVYVSISEEIPINGEMKSFSKDYKLNPNTGKLTASAMNTRFWLNPENYPPYDSDSAEYCSLDVTVNYKGVLLDAYYQFVDRNTSGLTIKADFFTQGLMKNCTVERMFFKGQIACFAMVGFDRNGQLTSISLQLGDDLFFSLTAAGSNEYMGYDRVQKDYPGVNLRSDGIHAWIVSMSSRKDHWEEYGFATMDDLLIQEEDGMVRINTDAKDINETEFPFTAFTSLMDPEMYTAPMWNRP